MWNSVLLDGVKWSFDRSSPPLMDDTNNPADQQESQFRSWDYKSHHQTNYADWTNKQDSLDETEDGLFLTSGHNTVDNRTNNYPSAAELFRNFVGDEGADRMEFYINHLTMEGCDANNIAAAFMSEAETAATQQESSSQNVVYRPPFPLLETITEETMEELLLDMSDSSSLLLDESSESPSSNSGRWGWGWGWLNTSDDDSSSVIHVPVEGESLAALPSGPSVNQSELADIKSGIYRPDGLDVDFDLCNDDDEDDDDDGEWSERDQEVPKKKRRMDEDDEESGSSRSPSVTDSLIQFEALEKELGSEEPAESVVFRTSATSLPFEDADDGILSTEMDQEVFLDCQEHCHDDDEEENGLIVEISRLLETSSARFSDFLLESFQLGRDGQHSTTCGSSSSPPRTWCSMPSLDYADQAEEEEEEDEDEATRSQSWGDFPIEASGSLTDQEENVVARPSWVITFDPPQETGEDEQLNDDDHWEPDGFLNSDIEEYDTGSNSDDDEDYSTERGDRFDEFGLAFISGRSQRMRSFRSYGDSLNLLDTTDDPVSNHSTSSSSSSCSPDRSSPEEDHRHPSSSRSRRSVEALSEDSGYGDASGSVPPIQQQHQVSPVDPSNNGGTNQEELRLAGPSTPPAKSHTLELPSLTICPPDGSALCSSQQRQWLPEVEVNRPIREAGEEGDWNKSENADGLSECQQIGVESTEPMEESALLSRRQPRCRPTPLSLKEAEAFLILQDDAPEVVDDCQSRCGVICICIDLEYKMSHTLKDGGGGNVVRAVDDATAATATNDDILQPTRTDLESKFNPQIGGSGVSGVSGSNDSIDGRWEVPDLVGEAGAKERARTEAEGQGADHHPHEKQQDSLLLLLYHSDGSDFIQEPDATQDNCSSRDWTDHNVTDSNSIAMDSAFYPAPVVLKRYGPRQEVEVYISQQQLPVTNESAPIPSPSSAASGAASHIRGVHFSPVVSAVNWRESYLNQSEDESDADSDLSADPSTKNSGDGSPSDPSLLPTKVRVESRPEVAPSVVQRVKLSGESTPTTTPSTPTDVVVVQSSESQYGQSQPDSGRNSSNSTSCTTTATTNSKKPALFQRFSLSRLSARMSATFSRSESKRESGKKADCPLATEPKNVVSQVAVVAEEAAKNSSNNSNNSKEKKNKNKSESDAKSSAKKIDDLKVVKEPKKRFFSRSPFQRSWSTPPMSNPVAAQGPAIQTRATGSVAASGKDKDANSSNDSCHHLVEQSDAHQESVARQPNSSPDVIPSLTGQSVAAIDDSRRSLVDADTPEPQQPESEQEQGSPIAPIPAARTKVQASHAKPPLPPQTKPRTIHARKNYLGSEQQQQQQQQSPPPVPMVSSAGLQHALQHFKETARMERERLANSVPDLAAPSTPTPRPTSDCIDPRESSSLSSTCVDSTAPALPPRPVVLAGSRERARQAVLSRASSVESAWNATASRAALNLSRRNIASSSSTKTQNGPTQGHGPTKSRPVVPGLLETNLDSVPSSYGRHRIDNDDETNLDELIQNLQLFCSNNNNNNNSGRRDVDYSTAQPLSVEAGSATTNADKRFKSMLNLGSSSAPVSVQPDIDMLTDPANSARVPDSNNRAKSMEFLLDEDNKSAVQVPENQLKKCGERKMSEHELRIQRSLQKLNVPEWYKNNARSALGHGPASATSNGSSSVTSTGVLRRRDYHGGSVSSRNGGWSGLSASNRDAGTASSMTSLGSALSRSGTPTRVVIPTRVRPDWRNIKSSRESLSSPADTCHSPSWNGPTSLSSTQQSFARWGSGRSSYSTCPSPAPSTSSSASAYRTSLLNQHGRAPYLGWRSQERLNNTPAPLSIYQSPAERLASTLLTKTNHVSTAPKSGTDGNSCERDSRMEDEATPSQPQDINEQQQQEVDEVVRSSIRQVTSAIVHYVSESSDGDQPPSPASRNGLSRSPERHPLEALSRSPSPRRQRCVWVESSFVGGPSNDSPNTNRHRPASPARPESPPSSGSSHHSHHRTANNGRPGLSDRTVVGSLSVAERDDSPAALDAKSTPQPPISATLDDVLNSLLGLAPPPIHGPLRRPVSQPTIHNKQVHHQQQQGLQQQPYQHQQQMRGNGNNNNPTGQVSIIQEARSFSDLRSSTYTGSSSQANN